MQEKFKSLVFEEGVLKLLDQRLLPNREELFICRNCRDVIDAVRDMVVRGAPAIGASAAYGYYLAARECAEDHTGEAFFSGLAETSRDLERARPTAVNLRWALQRMERCTEAHRQLPIQKLLEALLAEAHAVTDEDIETNRKLSRIGAEVIPENAAVLTHCNTGALATAGWGTALGVIKEAHYSGKQVFVYADETRPRLQGARLTAWELIQEGIPSKLIADSTAAALIRDRVIDCVILGADRVAANGDVCNKIGTFMLAVVCSRYNVPFYSACPVSTIDFDTPTGEDIPIEQRDAEELLQIEGTYIAPPSMEVYNPAFDVTPHELVTGIITEAGILRPPFAQAIAELKNDRETVIVHKDEKGNLYLKGIPVTEDELRRLEEQGTRVIMLPRVFKGL